MLRAERAAGRMPAGARPRAGRLGAAPARAGAPVNDVRADELSTRARGTLGDAVSGVLAFLGIGDDKELQQQVLSLATELQAAR